MKESTDYRGTPTRDALDKTMINLYRRAYYDWRQRRNPYNKKYLEGIQDALLAIMGRSKYDKVRNSIKSDFVKDKLR